MKKYWFYYVGVFFLTVAVGFGWYAHKSPVRGIASEGNLLTKEINFADVEVGEQYGKMGFHIKGGAADQVAHFMIDKVSYPRFGKELSIGCDPTTGCLVLLKNGSDGSYKTIEHDPWATVYLSYNKDENELVLSIKSKGIATKTAWREEIKEFVKEGDVVQFHFKQ